jgi:hypothetical protein
MKTLNERLSLLSMRRRYEVWFFGVGLNEWSLWFRYLVMNPGRARSRDFSLARLQKPQGEQALLIQVQ